MGAIGFEGRWDYTCIGSVTNHAARLCGEAKGGQILTNHKTYARIENLARAEPLGEMHFKGVAEPVPVVSITGLAT
jgi:adenylate cyclase